MNNRGYTYTAPHLQPDLTARHIFVSRSPLRDVACFIPESDRKGLVGPPHCRQGRH